MPTSSLYDPYAPRDAATGLDAELIYLHAECMRLEQEHEEACLAADRRETEVGDQLPPFPAEGDTKAEAEREAAEERLGVAALNRARDAIDDAVDRATAHLAAKPAQTVVGLHLKLSFARFTHLLDLARNGTPAADLVASALDDAKRLSETTDEPDPVVDLIAQYHDAAVRLNAIEVRDGRGGDTEVAHFFDDIITPLEDELARVRPTARAGVVALLDLVITHRDEERIDMGQERINSIIDNVRDALKRAAPGAMVPIKGPGEDPIFGLIAALQKARAAIRSKKQHVAALRAKIPAEVSDWPYRSASKAEIAEHQRSLAEWYVRVGMPFTPESEDAYWEADFAAYNEAELALIEGEARTMAGFTAKVANLTRMRQEVEGKIDFPGYLEAVEAHGRLSCEAMLAAFARDAAALIERPVAPGSDVTNEGSSS